MGVRKLRFVLSSVLTGIVLAGLLAYGLIRGLPQWNGAFQGALVPTISAYRGWLVSIGIVTVGLVTVGICIAVSWIQGTWHYLVLALGAVSVLVFVSLGLPVPVIAEITYILSFVVMGLCGLLVAGVFLFALKDRFSSRGRTLRHG